MASAAKGSAESPPRRRSTAITTPGAPSKPRTARPRRFIHVGTDMRIAFGALSIRDATNVLAVYRPARPSTASTATGSEVVLDISRHHASTDDGEEHIFPPSSWPAGEVTVPWTPKTPTTSILPSGTASDRRALLVADGKAVLITCHNERKPTSTSFDISRAGSTDVLAPQQGAALVDGQHQTFTTATRSGQVVWWDIDARSPGSPQGGSQELRGTRSILAVTSDGAAEHDGARLIYLRFNKTSGLLQLVLQAKLETSKAYFLGNAKIALPKVLSEAVRRNPLDATLVASADAHFIFVACGHAAALVKLGENADDVDYGPVKFADLNSTKAVKEAQKRVRELDLGLFRPSPIGTWARFLPSPRNQWYLYLSMQRSDGSSCVVLRCIADTVWRNASDAVINVEPSTLFRIVDESPSLLSPVRLPVPSFFRNEVEAAETRESDEEQHEAYEEEGGDPALDLDSGKEFKRLLGTEQEFLDAVLPVHRIVEEELRLSPGRGVAYNGRLGQAALHATCWAIVRKQPRLIDIADNLSVECIIKAVHVISECMAVTCAQLEGTRREENNLLLSGLPSPLPETLELSSASLATAAQTWPVGTPRSVLSVLTALFRAGLPADSATMARLLGLSEEHWSSWSDAPWLYRREPFCVPKLCFSVPSDEYKTGISAQSKPKKKGEDASGHGTKYERIDVNVNAGSTGTFKPLGFIFEGKAYDLDDRELQRQLTSALQSSPLRYPVFVPTRGLDDPKCRIQKWAMPAGAVVIAVMRVNDDKLSPAGLASSLNTQEKLLRQWAQSDLHSSAAASCAEAEHSSATSATAATTARGQDHTHATRPLCVGVLAYHVTHNDVTWRSMRQVSLDFARDQLGLKFRFQVDDSVNKVTQVLGGQDVGGHTDQGRNLALPLRLLQAVAQGWPDSGAPKLGAIGCKGWEVWDVNLKNGGEPMLRRGHVKWLGLFATDKCEYRLRRRDDIDPNKLFKNDAAFDKAGPCEDLCFSYDLNKSNMYVGTLNVYWITKVQKVHLPTKK